MVFLMNQIYVQSFIIFKKWGIGVNYCWNCVISKLLLHFIEYCLDQLKSKLTKIAGNSAIQHFEGCCQKMSKSLKFFGPPTTKWQSSKIIAKLNRNHFLMASIFTLHEYQAFGLMKMHNMCKIGFASKMFSLLRWSKQYFSWFFKGFQLLEIILRLQLYWPLKENFCVISQKKLKSAILWDIVARIFSYYWIQNLQNFLR